MSSEKNPTRSRIIQATRDLLEDGSGSAVRMSDIAKRAGISRQALYLHFPNRADLLVAAARHVDETANIDARLLASRNADSGQERLAAFVAAWGNYIPVIYGMAKAFWAMMDHDEEARVAWHDRMRAMKEGCTAAVLALENDGDLSSVLTVEEASDLLWVLLSVRNWEQFRFECGWTQDAYLRHIQYSAERILRD
ncbi:MAG: TetR/AcrR family transcriptional regulator [Arenibacterium sp.]